MRVTMNDLKIGYKLILRKITHTDNDSTPSAELWQGDDTGPARGTYAIGDNPAGYRRCRVPKEELWNAGGCCLYL